MPATPPTPFGTLLRQIRKRSGLSQQQLAGYLGISTARVSKLETGSSDPPQDPQFYDRLRTVPGFSDTDIVLLREAAEADKSTEVVRKRIAVIDEDEVTLEESVVTTLAELADYAQKLIEEKAKVQQKFAEVLEKSMAIREAEARFGTPGRAGIKIRREGILRRENPEDRKRYEALKANWDRAILTAHHLKDLGGFAASGQQFVLDVADHLMTTDTDLLSDLKPIEQMYAEQIYAKLLITTYTEALKMLSVIGLEEIARATAPATQAAHPTVEEAQDILTESSQTDVSISFQEVLNVLKELEHSSPIPPDTGVPNDASQVVEREAQPTNQPEQEDQTNPNETTQPPKRVRRENQRAHESLEQTFKRLHRKYGEDQFIITAHRVYEDAKGIQYQAMAKNVPVKYVSIGQAAEESQIANQTLATWVADGLLHNVTKVEQPSKSESGIVLVEPREVMKLKEKLEVGTEAAEPKLITLPDAARKYELPYGTVRSWYKRGHLPEKGREVFGTHGGGKILVDEKEVIRLKSQPPARGKPPIKLTE